MSSSGLGLAWQILEERGPAHVGGALVPLKRVARRDLERVPALVAVEHLAVAGTEHVGLDRLPRPSDRPRASRARCPSDTPARVLVEPRRLVVEVDVHRPGERIGPRIRRRRQVVHLDIWLMRPSKLRVPDSTETTARSSAPTTRRSPGAAGRCCRCTLCSRKPTRLKAELVQILGQARSVEVLGDDLGGRAPGMF